VSERMVGVVFKRLDEPNPSVGGAGRSTRRARRRRQSPARLRVPLSAPRTLKLGRYDDEGGSADGKDLPQSAPRLTTPSGRTFVCCGIDPLTPISVTLKELRYCPTRLKEQRKSIISLPKWLTVEVVAVEGKTAACDTGGSVDSGKQGSTQVLA
jgi:hypothetical protein